MIAADAVDAWIGLMGMAGVIGAAMVAGHYQNRKTRAMNTAEHERSAQERAENREAVLHAIGMLHDDVSVIRSEQQVIKGDLRSHIEDHRAHPSGELV